jgi:hypothetical protein
MAKPISNKALKKQYEFVCNEYIRKFSEKQEIEFDGWIGDDIGGIASFIDQYFFNFQDIVWDINSNQPKDLILQWQDECINYSIENPEQSTMNYFSYCKGLRISDLKND